MANQPETQALIQNAFAHVQTGKKAEAINLYRQIREVAPDDYETILNYGNLSLILGEIIAAIKAFSELVAIDPDNALYLGLLGKAFLQNGQLKEAVHVLSQAIEIGTATFELLDYLGDAYTSMGEFSTAVEILQKALLQKPREMRVHANLATCLLRIGRHDEALVHAKIAAKLDAKSSYAQYATGCIYMELGQHETAISCFHEAIKLDKTFGYAYQTLAQCKKANEQDRPFISKAEKILKEGIPASARSDIHFCLGKMYDDLKQWDKAFEHYKQGNLLRRDVKIPDFLKKVHQKSKKVFTKKLLNETQPRGLETELPVFIVGMPRSGSTLIEQIIASHPQASGAGELTELDNIARIISPYTRDSKSFVKDWHNVISNSDALKRHAETYLHRLRKDKGSVLRIVDKQLQNFFRLGMIQLLFPNATIIHSVRDPLDTCLSCFFQAFRQIGWASDLVWIGKRYHYYRELVDHWKAVLPSGKITDVHYEELIADPESQARRIIDACRLEWDPLCLDFHKTNKTVGTASQWQVRQPIYRSSMKRWHHYAPYLGELANEIQRYLTEEDIAFLESSGARIKKRRRFAWF